MRDSVAKSIELFEHNMQSMRKAFFWADSQIAPIGSMVFTQKGIAATPEQIKDAKKTLKSKAGFFSNFRGYGYPAMVCTLAADKDPEKRMSDSAEAYKILKKYFFTNTYLPLAAMTLAGFKKLDEFDAFAQESRDIYDQMKKSHFFLTSYEDEVMCLLIALSPKADQSVVEESNAIYEALKKKFFSKDAVQSLSHVLALEGDGSPEQKVERFWQFFNAFKEQKHKYPTGLELSTLGIITLLDQDPQEAVKEIIEVENRIKKIKGMSIWHIGPKSRRMMAASLYTYALLGESETLSAMSAQSIIALIIAQQQAMIAAMVASSAARQSSNN